VTNTVQFFFDPTCPWTWLTSRWLVDVAGQLNLEVEWRSLSLALVNADREVPEKYRAPMQAGKAALRLVEAGREAGRPEQVGRYYTELGTRLHHDGAEPRWPWSPRWPGRPVSATSPGPSTTRGGTAPLPTPTTRPPRRRVPAWARPVVVPPGATIGFFGPIVSPPPTGDAAASLWRLVIAAVTMPGLYELKRGRTSGPQLGGRPA